MKSILVILYFVEMEQSIALDTNCSNLLPLDPGFSLYMYIS